MNRSLLITTLTILTGGANAAGIPQLNYSCPGDIEVHADDGGPVYINGEETNINKFSDTYYEARTGKVTVSIMLSDDGSVSVSYTGSGGANGICQPS